MLHPLGVVVVADDEDPALPFADDAFDLVTSRHPATVHWSEITRVLASGGTYLAQHVGGGTNVELHDQIEQDGVFRSTMSRTLFEARKPPTT